MNLELPKRIGDEQFQYGWRARCCILCAITSKNYNLISIDKITLIMCD